IGVFLLWTTFGTVGFEEILFNPKLLAEQHVLNPELIELICLCLFMGAVGKSAQFPLHVWLPDAMEGPTPVSALIHAATMVTAGVYMVARLYPIFAGPGFFVSDFWGSPPRWVVAGIRSVTAILA